MISYIKGTIEDIYDGEVVIECNKIGYLVQVSASTMSRLVGKNEIKLYTYMQVREDAVSLVGFLSKEDYKMFALLTSVSGVGAKAALSIQSVLSASQIMLAILTDDTAALSKAQGVGKKIAQRIALELKDKIKAGDAVSDMAVNPQQSIAAGGATGAKQDAVDALLALGYGRSEAVRAVMEVAIEGIDAEKIIKLALKKLASF